MADQPHKATIARAREALLCDVRAAIHPQRHLRPFRRLTTDATEAGCLAIAGLHAAGDPLLRCDQLRVRTRQVLRDKYGYGIIWTTIMLAILSAVVRVVVTRLLEWWRNGDASRETILIIARSIDHG